MGISDVPLGIELFGKPESKIKGWKFGHSQRARTRCGLKLLLKQSNYGGTSHD